jgi:hypothetical protein
MRGYIDIPKSISCTVCKHCGTRPIIAMIGNGEYVVKCQADNSHYQTSPGLINIEDWNLHNIQSTEAEFDHASMIACYDSQLNYTLFLPV